MFSASLPPFLASAAVSAVNYLEGNPSVLTSLRSNIALLWKGEFCDKLHNAFAGCVQIFLCHIMYCYN